MLEEHTQSTLKLKEAAAKITPAVAVDPTPTAEQQAALSALMALPPGDLDRAYINAQILAHESAFTAFKAYAGAGDMPSLKAFAREMATPVANHLELVRKINP